MSATIQGSLWFVGWYCYGICVCLAARQFLDFFKDERPSMKALNSLDSLASEPIDVPSADQIAANAEVETLAHLSALSDAVKASEEIVAASKQSVEPTQKPAAEPAVAATIEATEKPIVSAKVLPIGAADLPELVAPVKVAPALPAVRRIKNDELDRQLSILRKLRTLKSQFEAASVRWVVSVWSILLLRRIQNNLYDVPGVPREAVVPLNQRIGSLHEIEAAQRTERDRIHSDIVSASDKLADFAHWSRPENQRETTRLSA